MAQQEFSAAVTEAVLESKNRACGLRQVLNGTGHGCQHPQRRDKVRSVDGGDVKRRRVIVREMADGADPVQDDAARPRLQAGERNIASGRFFVACRAAVLARWLEATLKYKVIPACMSGY